uniref:Uncharacterized protein n=1 Tax=Isometrus maculatus TaxID=497827 RepID=A0A0U1TYE5_ISOMC|nr:hypothetical protein [Isometrus maculatus]
MPTFTISTNLPKEKIPAEFLKTAAETLAKTLGKPLSDVHQFPKPGQGRRGLRRENLPRHPLISFRPQEGKISFVVKLFEKEVCPSERRNVLVKINFVKE